MIDWRKAVVEWCRETKRIDVFDDPRREPVLPSTAGGAYYTDVSEREYDDDRVELNMMITFHTIVTRDQLPVGVVHESFMKVGQYRDIIAPDCHDGIENPMVGGDDDG